MFFKKYVGHHGRSTFVRGVWTENAIQALCRDLLAGERAVRVTRVGHEDDEIGVGDVLTLDEVNGITEGDVFAYAGGLERYAVV